MIVLVRPVHNGLALATVEIGMLQPLRSAASVAPVVAHTLVRSNCDFPNRLAFTLDGMIRFSSLPICKSLIETSHAIAVATLVLFAILNFGHNSPPASARLSSLRATPARGNIYTGLQHFRPFGNPLLILLIRLENLFQCSRHDIARRRIVEELGVGMKLGHNVLPHAELHSVKRCFVL